MAQSSFAERLMGMSDATWERHANPLSGWTRIAVFPLFTLAVWSRVWIAEWSLIVVLAVLAWVWINPRAFPPPKHHDHWMSKGVLGERVWLRRQDAPFVARHKRMAILLNSISGLAVLPYAWGLWTLDIWPTLFGMSVSMLAKLWFIDRMVWLYETEHA